MRDKVSQARQNFSSGIKSVAADRVIMAINLTAAYVKILNYDRIDSEEICTNKSNKSKECIIFHYWYLF